MTTFSNNSIALARNQELQKLPRILAYGIGGSLAVHGIAAVMFNYLPKQLPNDSVEVTLIDKSELPKEFQPSPTPTPSITTKPKRSVQVSPTPTPSVKITPIPTPSAKITPNPTPSVKVTPIPTPLVKVKPTPTPSVKAKPERKPQPVEIVTKPVIPVVPNQEVSQKLTFDRSNRQQQNTKAERNNSQSPPKQNSSLLNRNSGMNRRFSGGTLSSGSNENSNQFSDNWEGSNNLPNPGGSGFFASRGSGALSEFSGSSSSAMGGSRFDGRSGNGGGEDFGEGDGNGSAGGGGPGGSGSQSAAGNGSGSNGSSLTANGRGQGLNGGSGIAGNSPDDGVEFSFEGVPGSSGSSLATGSGRSGNFNGGSGNGSGGGGDFGEGDGNGFARGGSPSGNGSRLGKSSGFGSGLECLVNCNPEYPDFVEYEVVVEFNITLDNKGRVVTANLSKPSKNRDLNNFAQAEFSKMQFQLPTNIKKRIFSVKFRFSKTS